MPRIVPAHCVRSSHLGDTGTLSQRVLFSTSSDRCTLISPLDHIPLFSDSLSLGILNNVCMTPAGTWVEYEVAMDEPFNPLRIAGTGKPSMWKSLQNTFQIHSKSRRCPPLQPMETASDASQFLNVWCDLILSKATPGKVRPAHYTDNVPWNIGILPQTGAMCDLDIDNNKVHTVEVIEVGADKIRKVGEVYPVKPLAGFAVKEDDHCRSLKIVAIALDDPLASCLHNAADLQTYLPGILPLVCSWIKSRHSEQADGKSSLSNHDIKPLSALVTMEEIKKCNKFWQRYSRGKKKAQHVPLYEVTFSSLRNKWEQRVDTATRQAISENCIPRRCPATQTSVIFDLSWFGRTDSHTDKKNSIDLESKNGHFNIKVPLHKVRKGLARLWIKQEPKKQRKYTKTVETVGGLNVDVPPVKLEEKYWHSGNVEVVAKLYRNNMPPIFDDLAYPRSHSFKEI